MFRPADFGILCTAVPRLIANFVNEKSIYMNKILSRICSISNHPVSKLDVPFREKYVNGLGACLFMLSKDSPVTKMFFYGYAKSILGDSSCLLECWREDLKAIKRAISIQRKGIKLFSMKNHFFFDSLYLLEESLQHEYDRDKTVAILQTDVCGFFTKGALNRALAALVDGKPEGVDKVLIEHRKKNLLYASANEKRVLVVANVSAGKSTLINALVGERINRTKTTVCTNKLTYIHNKQEQDGVTIKKANDKYEYFDEISKVDSEQFVHASFHFKSYLSKSAVCFVDTPGVNNALDEEHKKITEDTIKANNYDVLVYVSNCQYFGTNDEHFMLSFLKRNVRKPIIFVLNQLDRFKIKEDSISKMLNDYKCDLLKFGFSKPVIIPVSAQAAVLSKIEETYLDEDDIYDKEMFIKKFKKEYYDLSSYVSKASDIGILNKTGINLLEKTILNLM